MAQQVIDVGTSASDGTGDPLRDAFTKVNDNFTELYGTAENQGLTYGNVSSNVAGVTFNVTRYTESYTATPVLEGTGQSVGNVYVIQGNVLGGSTPINDVYLTVTALANVTVGNIATVSAVGTPTAPVLRVNGLTGNVTLTVNNIDGAASRAYVNAAIAANVANVTGTITDSLRANITAANAAISSNSARISTLESNAATQAAAISNLDNTKATISYVDTSIDLALSSNAILADVAAVNANVAAANAAILLRANLSGADFTGNITANGIRGLDSIRAETYFVAGSEALQQLGESWANPAALFFGNSAAPGSPTLYYQINLQNLDPAGSGDIVVTADDGNDLGNYIAMGVNGSQYSDPLYPFGLAHDGYLAVFGGNLKLQSNTANIELLAGNLTTAQVSLTTGNVLHLKSNVVIKFSDGTVQSTAFGGNANVTSINANVTAANLAIAGLQSNAAAQALDIDALYANAGTQAASLSTLTANAATQAISIDGLLSNVTTLISNAATQSVAISSLQSNTAAANLIVTALTANSATQALELDNLQSNAQAQQSAIIVLQSNSSVQAVAIDLLNANITAANTNIASLTSNAATQSSQINLLNANVTAANVNITTLFANAASQALDIDNLYANVNYYLANVASSDANIAAANARIVILDANLGSTSSNVSALESNAAAQALSIDLLNANVTAANINIDNKADLSGAIFDGNIQANYIFANSNIHVASILQVGNTSPNNIPGLGSIFVGNVTTDYQVVIQNLSTSSNATTALKILPDDGYDENNFIKIGINSSQYLGNVILPQGDSNLIGSPRDGYVVTYGGNTSIRSDRNIFMAANTVVVGLIKDSNNFALISANLQFSDGTIQTTAIQDVSGLYANIGALAVFQSNILGNATYTPNNASNYNGTITNIQQALDELAARLRALGG